MDGVAITSNDITAESNPFKFFEVNMETEYQSYEFNVTGNKLSTPDKTLFLNSYGISFKNNELDHGIEVFNCENIYLAENKITDKDDHGLHLRQANLGINISDNIIDVEASNECIKIENTTSSNEVTQINNSCL